jgi:hypothetical protein
MLEPGIEIRPPVLPVETKFSCVLRLKVNHIPAVLPRVVCAIDIVVRATGSDIARQQLG